MPTFKAGKYVYIYKSPRTILPAEARRVAIVSYSKFITKVCEPCKKFTVLDANLTILENGVVSTINNYRATKAPGF